MGQACVGPGGKVAPADWMKVVCRAGTGRLGKSHQGLPPPPRGGCKAVC